MSVLKVAFHATLKPPDHPTPSGDRTVARLILAALTAAGAEVTMPSRLPTRARTGDGEEMSRLRAAAEAEAGRLIAMVHRGEAQRPDVWLTYHLYYKAPDWIGATVARALAVPYVVAEASYAGKRDLDGWAPWQREMLGQLRQADAVLCLSPADRAGIAPLVADARLFDFPPFLDPAPFAMLARPEPAPGAPTRLVAVAMMREGVKLDSYRHLAAALGQLGDRAWSLTIVGDGPARDKVQAAFTHLPGDRIVWAGLADDAGVRAVLGGSDILVWPGIGEAFGMVYLEAAAAGVPAIAYASDGVAAVVRDSKTGIMVPPHDVAGLAGAIAALIDDPVRRAGLATAARTFATGERSLAHAAVRLSDVLYPLVGKPRPTGR